MDDTGFEAVVLQEFRALREASERIEAQLRSFASSTLQDTGGPPAPPAVYDSEVMHLGSKRSKTSFESGDGTGFRATAPSEIRFVSSSLPLDWPSVLRMRSCLCKDDVSPMTPVRNGRLSLASGAATASLQDVLAGRHVKWRDRTWFDPNSRFFMLYSFSSLLVLLCDMTVVPFALAWGLDSNKHLLGLSWFTAIFWTLDIFIHFNTAYYADGDIVIQRRKIARHYIGGWFVVDVVVVLVDWCSFIVEFVVGDDGGANGRSLKLLRFSKLGRLLRVVGMLRMVRVVRMMEDFVSQHLTEGYRLVCRMAYLLLVILWAAHVLACGWYAVGSAAPSDTGARWVDSYVNSGYGEVKHFSDVSVLYQYLTAFHWAAGQISLGALDSYPRNSWERIVFILAMMLGFLFGSSVVSTLSASMIDYQMMQKGNKMKMRTLRRYLLENEVPPHVALPVQRQAEQQLAHREPVAEGAVAALELVSVALRSQLRFEIQRPQLLRHPMFRLWTSINVKMMHRACMKAVSFEHLRPQDDLFGPGSAASAAHILVSGTMSYTQYPDSSPENEEVVQPVAVGQWLCEAALWVEWTCVGKAETHSSCQLLAVDAEDLSSCVQQDSLVRDLASEYGKQFHKRVTSACPPHAPWPTDLAVPFTDYCDLVVSMRSEVQLTIGREAVHYLSTSRAARSIDKLREEVESLKSIVLVTGEGAVIRAVSLVVLRAEDDCGRVFMQVGKWEAGAQMKGDLQLPGAKQDADELVGETLERMFATKVSLLQGKLHFTGTTREMHEKVSKDFGVQTRYSRSICSARLLPGCELSAPLCGRPVQQDMGVSMSASARVCRSLDGADIFAVRADDESGRLYSWLPPEAVAKLTAHGGDKMLLAWLSEYSLPVFPERAEGVHNMVVDVADLRRAHV